MHPAWKLSSYGFSGYKYNVVMWGLQLVRIEVLCKFWQNLFLPQPMITNIGKKRREWGMRCCTYYGIAFGDTDTMMQPLCLYGPCVQHALDSVD